MKRVIRENIQSPYSLHDMNVIAFDVKDNGMVMRTQSGIINTSPPCCQEDGYVEFHDVRWDFSYVYLIDFNGNTGSLTGEKLFLKDFILKMESFGFCIMDETYGFNTT